MMEPGKSWTLDLAQDPESGELVLELTPEILTVTGWQVGDELEWTDLGNGSWSLGRKETT